MECALGTEPDGQRFYPPTGPDGLPPARVSTTSAYALGVRHYERPAEPGIDGVWRYALVSE